VSQQHLHIEEPPVEPRQPDLVEGSSPPLLDPPPHRRFAASVEGAVVVVVEAAPSVQICKVERERGVMDEKIAIIGLQSLGFISNKTTNICFFQIGLQTLFVSSNNILIQLTIF